MSIEFPQATISRLKAPEALKGQLQIPGTDEERLALLASFVEKTVADYKGKMEFSPQSHPKKKEGNFAVKIYHSRTAALPSLGKQLQPHNESTSFEAHSNHFLFFFYRTIEKTIEVSKKWIADIYAVTTNQGWTVVRSHVSYQFPQRVAMRFTVPQIQGMTSRDLSGPKLLSKTRYREGSTLTKLAHLYHVIQEIDTLFKLDSSVNCALQHTGEHQVLKQTSGVTIKLGGIRVLRQMDAPTLVRLLHIFSSLYTQTPTYRCPTGEVEEDDPELYFLKFVRVVEPAMVVRLNAHLMKTLESALAEGKVPTCTIWHRYGEDYGRGDTFTLVSNKVTLATWNVPPTAHQIFPLLAGCILEKTKLIVTSPARKIEGLLTQFVEGEFQMADGRVFFRLGGKWLFVTAEFLVSLYCGLRVLLKEHLTETDAIALNKTWISQEKWASFAFSELEDDWDDVKDFLKLFDPKKKKQGKKRQRSVASFFTGKAQSARPKPDERFVVVKNLPATASVFLQRKRAEYRQIQDEGAYNESFLNSSNCLVGDRVLAFNLELFDLLRWTDTHVYVYHVKESFAQSTRDACSQILNSAEQIKNAMVVPNSQSNVLVELWNAATREPDKKKPNGYRAKVRKKFLRVGRENFLSLFNGKRKVVYVYAFLDSSAQEKLLKDEMTPDPIDLKEPYFNQLLESGYIHKNGKLTDLFFSHTNKSFSLKGLSKKENQALFLRLCKGLTKNQSTIAKMEMFRVKDALYHLGFDFNIFQIRRGDTNTLEEEEEEEIPLTPPVSQNFTLGESSFELVDTPKDGACGLHALFGTVEDGQCVAENPKGRYVHLVQMHSQDPDLKNILKEFVNLDTFKEDRKRIEARKTVLLNEEEELWMALLKTVPVFSLPAIKAELRKHHDLKNLSLTFTQPNWSSYKGKLIHAINGRMDALLPKTPQSAQRDVILRKRHERLHLFDLLDAQIEEHITKPEVLESYLAAVRNPSYFHSTLEIKFAAKCLRIHFLIFTYYEEAVIADSNVQAPFPADTVVIHQLNAHYSRCEKLDL